jgi:hypothetical protein
MSGPQVLAITTIKLAFVENLCGYSSVLSVRGFAISQQQQQKKGKDKNESVSRFMQKQTTL